MCKNCRCRFSLVFLLPASVAQRALKAKRAGDLLLPVQYTPFYGVLQLTRRSTGARGKDGRPHLTVTSFFRLFFSFSASFRPPGKESEGEKRKESVVYISFPHTHTHTHTLSLSVSRIFLCTVVLLPHPTSLSPSVSRALCNVAAARRCAERPCAVAGCARGKARAAEAADGRRGRGAAAAACEAAGRRLRAAARPLQPAAGGGGPQQPAPQRPQHGRGARL